ncbi:MAG: FtsX-like permease family protein [Patescibacteria group bacterium]
MRGSDDGIYVRPIKPKDRDKEPGAIKTLRYTISYIRFNFFAFLLNILTIGIAGISIMAFGYLAYAGYQEARSKLENSQTKKIIVSCVADERLDETKRFNAKKIEEMKKLPWVVVAFERVCQNVYLNISGGDPKLSYIEGTIPHDPEIDPLSMEWGGGVSSQDSEEIVVTSSLLDELIRPAMGRAGESRALRPEVIRLTVRRTAGNEEKDFRREYQLVGVLNSKIKKAFIPLRQAKYLEMWCGSKIDDMPVVGGKISQPEIEVKTGRLYVSSNISGETLDQAKKHFQIDLKEIFSYREPVIGDIGEMRIFRKDNQAFYNADIAKLQSLLPNDVNIFSGNQVKATFRLEQREVKGAILQAFSLNDPRLRNLKMMDNKGIDTAITSLYSVVISKDLASRHLPYGLESQPDLVVEIGPFPVSLKIVGASEGYINDTPFDALCSLDTFNCLNLNVELKKFCLVVMTNRATAKRLKNGDYPVKKGQTAKTFPIIEKKIKTWDSDPSSKTVHSAAGADRRDSATAQINSSNSSFDAGDYCAIAALEGDRGSISKFIKDHFNDPKVEVIELSVVGNCKVLSGDKTREAEIAFCNPEEISHSQLPWAYRSYPLESGSGLASEEDFPSDYSIGIGDTRLDLVKIDQVFPRGYILVGQKKMSVLLPGLQKLEAKKSTDGEYLPGFLDVTINNPVSYENVKAAIEGQGLIVKEVRVPKNIQVTCYQFSSLQPDGKISRQLISSLKADRTFLDVCPEIKIEAAIGGLPLENKFSFIGSYVDDRIKTNIPVKLGGWLTGSSPNEVMLPEKMLANTSKDPKNLIGESVTLIFERQVKRSYGEPTLDVKCAVAGITTDDHGYLPLDLVKRAYLWQTGRLPYNERSGTFVSSENLYDKSGHESCKIYVRNIADVRPAVNYLRQDLGYDTEDYLKDQERIRELGRILTFLVMMIVVGNVISGILNVVITTLMNTKTRIYEIGILRAHGASNRLIKRIFFQLGLMMGFASFAVAFAAAPLVIELIAFSIKKAFSVELTRIMSVPFISFDYWWLHLLGLLITVLFCVFGVFWSALLACKTPIVKALISGK